MKKLLLGMTICTFLFGPGLLLVDQAASETIELKFAHFMSPKHIQHQKSFDPFCQEVAKLTGNRVNIKIYPGGALGGPKQLPDAAEAGITDIAFIIPSYTTARFPRMSAMDLPFMADSSVHATKIIYALYDKYMAPDFSDYKVLWLYSSGPGQLMSATKPMHTVEDLEGMKLRTPSAYMSKALKLLDVNPVGMPISKLTMSLQKKVIDGMVTPFSAVTDFRLFDLVSHISVVNLYVSPMAVVMNKEKWNSLPDFAKKAIDQASGKAWGFHAADVYDEHDTNTVLEINKRGKIIIYTPQPSEVAKLKAKLKVMQSDWLGEWSPKGIPAQEILDAVLVESEKTR